MPAENRIGREKRANLFESLATEDLALNCQSASLVVVEQNAFRAVLFPKNLVLGAKVFDRFFAAVGGSSLRLWLRDRPSFALCRRGT